MATTVSKVTYASTITAEMLAGLADVPVATDQTIKRNGHNTALTLRNVAVPAAGSNPATPPVTKTAYAQLTLSGGVLTLDLTACPGGADGQTVDFTGLKIRFVKVKAMNLSGVTPAGNLSAAQGATNGYTGAVSGWKQGCGPGGEFQVYFNDGAVLVDSTHKTIDFASGSGAEQFLVAVGGGI